MAKTTIHIKPDVMKLINKKKKQMGPKSTITGALMELARDGGRVSLLEDLVEETNKLKELVGELQLNNNGNAENIDPKVNEIMKDVKHVLCVSRRFAFKDDPELLKVADKDAQSLASKSMKGDGNV